MPRRSQSELMFLKTDLPRFSSHTQICKPFVLRLKKKKTCFGSQNYCQHFLGQEIGLENSELEDPEHEKWEVDFRVVIFRKPIGEEVGVSSNTQEQKRGYIISEIRKRLYKSPLGPSAERDLSPLSPFYFSVSELSLIHQQTGQIPMEPTLDHPVIFQCFLYQSAL